MYGTVIAGTKAMAVALGFACSLFVAVAGEAIPQLQLVQAWSVEYTSRLDPSGLCLDGETIFIVSDKIDDTIFRFDFQGDSALAVPAVRFEPPEPYPEVGRFDWEAITWAPEGGFLVASEWGFAAALVPRVGGMARWITPSVRLVGTEAGLFATPDAYVEGFAVLGPGHFLFGAEREPRGLIEVTMNPGGSSLVPQLCDESRFPVRAGRKPDWTDLFVWRSRVFALARNQSLVVELERSPSGSWVEGRAWSYQPIEDVAPYRYVDMTFGKGEGLAITDEMIYVLLDNNGLLRAGSVDDRRPWLFGFQNSILEQTQRSTD